jgi:primosomal protein N'
MALRSNDEKKFVDVVVPLPLRQAFTYFLPPELFRLY